MSCRGGFWSGVGSVVVVGQGSGCGNSIVVMGEEAVGGIGNGIYKGVGSGVPVVSGSPLVGAGVVNTDSPCLMS